MKKNGASKISLPILLMSIMLITLLFEIIPSSYPGLEDNPYLSTVVIQLVIYAIPSLFYCTYKGRGFLSTLRIRFFGLSSFLFVVSALVFMTAGTALIEYFLSMLSPEIMRSTSSAGYAAFALNSNLFDGVYLAIAFAILPALAEEFIFRGIMISEYSSSGIVCSVIMSSVMFAMCHLNPIRLPSYFFCGLVLAITVFVTGSLISTIIIHAVYNIFVIFFEEYVIHVAEKQNISGTLFIFVMVALVLLFGAFMSFEAAGIYKGYAQEGRYADYLPENKVKVSNSLLSAVFSPTFLVSVALFLVIVLIIRGGA